MGRPRRRRGQVVAVMLGWMLVATPSWAQWTVSGFLAARASLSEGRGSWLTGDFGGLAPGPAADGSDTVLGDGQAHVLVEGRWNRWRVFGHFTARGAVGDVDSGDLGGLDAGVIEAYVEGVLPAGGERRLRLQAGHFLLPTSLENVELGWSSPYTQSFSALNTWIGEEVRPTGLLAELNQPLGDQDSLRLGGSAFGGNDTSGTLLAWRGWTVGDRLSVWGEALPLPPLRGLSRGFAEQRDDGSQPFGSDLDNEVGWAGWLRWSRHDRALLQWTHFANRGDRKLHGSPLEREYAWDTTFDLLAAKLELGDWTVAAEWMDGDSFMGRPGTSRVSIDFETAYGLVSWSRSAWRASVRYDDFEVTDLDPIGYDKNDQDGDAWTVALFYEPRPDLRLGLEWVDFTSSRPEALTSAPLDPLGASTEGQRLQLELRWYFGL